MTENPLRRLNMHYVIIGILCLMFIGVMLKLEGIEAGPPAEPETVDLSRIESRLDTLQRELDELQSRVSETHGELGEIRTVGVSCKANSL